jgi:hypothetical protein
LRVDEKELERRTSDGVDAVGDMDLGFWFGSKSSQERRASKKSYQADG